MNRGQEDAEFNRANLADEPRAFASPSRLTVLAPLRSPPVVLVALAALASVLLPANLLATQRLHHDEALYAAWALQIVFGRDPWLTLTPIDKPPLFLYLLAGSLSFLGVSETAARLPSLLATAGIVLLTFSLGRRWYGLWVGLTAAWLVALSPFTLLFAPTAFTDPLLVLWVLAACLAASYGQAAWAGVSLGLAIATKQQGVFFGPLVIGVLIISKWLLVNGRKLTHKAANSKAGGLLNLQLLLTNNFLLFLLAFLLTLLPLLGWDFSRSQMPDVFTRSLDNYGGLALDWAGVGQRWQGFIDLLWYGTASPLLNSVFVVGLPLLLGYGWWQTAASKRPQTTDGRPETEDRRLETVENFQPSSLPAFQSSNLPALRLSIDLLFTLFTLAFLLAHALLSFQLWDRYLLGLIPFLALLLARILWLPLSILSRITEKRDSFYPGDAETQRFFKLNFLYASMPLWLNPQLTRRGHREPVYGLILALLLAVSLARPVQDAANGRYPLGSHSQALAGIEQVVAYLQGHAGANHTLFHRWLGTHWRFYLWGYPYDLQYWASPQELAAKAKPGYLIAFPSWRSETEARLALAEVGLSLHELARGYNPAGYPAVVLYEIVSSQSVD